MNAFDTLSVFFSSACHLTLLVCYTWATLSPDVLLAFSQRDPGTRFNYPRGMEG